MEVERPKNSWFEEDDEEQDDMALLARNHNNNKPVNGSTNGEHKEVKTEPIEEDEAELETEKPELKEEINGSVNGQTNGEHEQVKTEPIEANGAELKTEKPEPKKEIDTNIEEEEEDGDEATKSLDKHSVYFDSHHQKGSESVDGHSVSWMKYTSVESSFSETNSKDEESDTKTQKFEIQRVTKTERNHQNGKINPGDDDENSFSGLIPPPLVVEKLNLELLDNHNNKSEVKEVADELIEEIDEEDVDLDVERVLQKQNTHDLFCPNCNSCITRRVILLRKKKRKVRLIRSKPKPDRLEKVPELGADQIPDNSQGREIDNVGSSDGPYRQEDAFRCLSCFSVFVPTGNGFKLFRCFGDSNENENIQDVQNVPPSKQNWFFSIFSSDNKKAAIAQGAGNKAPENSGVDTTPLLNSSSGNDNPVPPLDGKAEVKTREPAEDSNIKYEQDGLESWDQSVVESILSEKPSVATDQKTNMATGNKVLADHVALSIPDVSSDIESFYNVGIVNGAAIVPQEAGKGPVNSSLQDSKPFSSVSINMGKKTDDAMAGNSTVVTQEAEKGLVNSSLQDSKPFSSVSINVGKKTDAAMAGNDTGNDVILTVATHQVEQNSSSLRTQDIVVSVETGNVPQSGTQIQVGQRGGVEAREVREWDILKSIVYGGLIESITSLAVVSSAAGAGATTLNILALGLANLFSGLFVIAHNLRELKKDHSREISNQTEEQESRYQQLLGRRENFSLHATVAILSFLIFGLLPPVVYGFSFRKSNDRDLKIAAVAGSSLICIILLAIGKGHFRKPTKTYFRTVLYYVSLGFASSGVSYVVGELIKKLMEKLGWFESTLDINLQFQQTNPMNAAWAAY